MALNTQNLRVLTSEEAREQGRRGGIASGEARRRKKALQDDILELLSLPLSDTALEKAGNFKDFGKKNVTIQQALIMKQIYKALVDGDTRAFAELCKQGGLSEEFVNLQVGGSVQVENPYANLTEEQLLRLANGEPE